MTVEFERKEIMKYLIEKKLGVSTLLMNYLEEKNIKEEDLKNGNIEKMIEEYESFQEYSEGLIYEYDLMFALRKRRGLSTFDISEDEEIQKMPKEEVLNEYLNWHGLRGWGDTIIKKVEEIYGLKLK